MTTLSESSEAPRVCQQQRFAMRGLLRVNEKLADQHDLALAVKVMAAATPDEYDRALGDKKVCALFLRGVLSFGEPHG